MRSTVPECMLSSQARDCSVFDFGSMNPMIYPNLTFGASGSSISQRAHFFGSTATRGKRRRRRSRIEAARFRAGGFGAHRQGEPEFEAFAADAPSNSHSEEAC